MDDKELERLAVQELLGEAKRGRERSETMGTVGWQKRSVTTNKRFLRNTLLATLPRKHQKAKSEGGSEEQLQQRSMRKQVSHFGHDDKKKVKLHDTSEGHSATCRSSDISKEKQRTSKHASAEETDKRNSKDASAEETDKRTSQHAYVEETDKKKSKVASLGETDERTRKDTFVTETDKRTIKHTSEEINR